MRASGAVILLFLLARSVSAQHYFYYSTADSIIYVQYPSFHDDTPLYLMRLHDGGTRMDMAGVESPGEVMFTDGIPGHVFSVKQNSQSGHRDLWRSDDYGEIWSQISVRPAHCRFDGPGRPGGLPGECTVVDDSDPPWIYSTSDSWATYDSVQFNSQLPGTTDRVYFSSIGYGTGLVYGVKLDFHTRCVSPDTTRTWAVGSYLDHEHSTPLMPGARDELWGFLLASEVFVALDTGRTVLDSLFLMHPPERPGYDWYTEIVPTDHPGEAYLLTDLTQWVGYNLTELIVYHIQDYGARVDSSYYQLVNYRLAAVEQRSAARGFELTAYPNPFNSTVNFAWCSRAGQATTVRVYNILGQAVWQWTGDDSKITWDGRSATGVSLSTGRYWVSVRNRAESRTLPVVILR